MPLPLAYAWRDLRSGLQGFWIFLTCLALGTAAIAIVGSLSAAIERGLMEQGQPLLGGDIEFSLVHREASERELAFMRSKGQVSKAATVRAMARAGEAATLVEVKAVDGLYPLYGALQLENDQFANRLNGAKNILVDALLLGRLRIAQDRPIRIGTTEFSIGGIIKNEPDRLSDGIIFGPRVIMSEDALRASGLIEPGSLVTWRYRIKLAASTPLREVKQIVQEAERQFPDAGWRIKSRDRAAAGADRFVERLTFFMTLVGLTSLIVGGAGIANAVKAFVDRRTHAIATLKCLGAPSRSVFLIYLTEVLLVALIGTAIGVIAGAATPSLAYATIRNVLPLPLTAHIEWLPLARAALFGLLITLAFAIWPLSNTRRIPASALFRHRIVSNPFWPPLRDLAVIAVALILVAVLAYASFDDWWITSYYLGGLTASFLVLMGLAWLIVRLAERSPKPAAAILRYAIANLYRPGSSAISVILALGLGLTLFVTLALTDRTIATELRSGLSEKAPAFFFLDVRSTERDDFVSQLQKVPGVTNIETAPMLRGRIVSVKGTPADKIAATPDSAWALRGDRGLTYADSIPQGSTLVEGSWWPKDYSGPPLVSFTEDIARGIGLTIGDEVSINVLGRDVTAKVANFRSVNWRTLNINFVMVFSPSTLKAAPHNHIVTVEMNGGDEAGLLNAITSQFPTVTAVRVKDALETVNALLSQMLSALRGANGLTLVTGVLVLAGALAAGLSNRIYDAVVLKTFGASRQQLIKAFAAEYAILGLFSALFGILVGSLASWFLAFWILEMPWRFSAITAVLTAILAVAITVAAGLVATWRALSVRPAPYLRNE
jgi:putative ABC transport system permease protein